MAGKVKETNILRSRDCDECLMNDDDILAMDQFDFVRFTAADIHGIGRCKSVPKRHFQHYARRGVDLFAGNSSGGFHL